MTCVATTLTTNRLILRQPVIADLPAYVSYCASPRTEFVGGPFDAAKAFEKFAAMSGHWALRGFGRYVMVKDDHPIGHVGPLQPDDSQDPEFTWTIWDGEHEGHGLAIEAAKVVRQHLLTDCGWDRMIVHVMPDNGRSCRIAERLGAQLLDEPAPSRYPDALTYHLMGGNE